MTTILNSVESQEGNIDEGYLLIFCVKLDRK